MGSPIPPSNIIWVHPLHIPPTGVPYQLPRLVWCVMDGRYHIHSIPILVIGIETPYGGMNMVPYRHRFTCNYSYPVWVSRNTVVAGEPVAGTFHSYGTPYRV